MSDYLETAAAILAAAEYQKTTSPQPVLLDIYKRYLMQIGVHKKLIEKTP